MAGPGDETTRGQVLAAVERFPGIHMRGIVKELRTSAALVQYHLDVLIADTRVRAVHVGGFVRYFPKAGYKELTAAERRMLSVLRQERPLEIALTLLEFGPLQHRQLLELVGGSKGTLTYHLQKLESAGVVEKVARGDGKGFHLVDPAAVRAILARYEPVPAILDAVHDTWEDLFGGHRRR